MHVFSRFSCLRVKISQIRCHAPPKMVLYPTKMVNKSFKSPLSSYQSPFLPLSYPILTYPIIFYNSFISSLNPTLTPPIHILSLLPSLLCSSHHFPYFLFHVPPHRLLRPLWPILTFISPLLPRFYFLSPPHLNFPTLFPTIPTLSYLRPLTSSEPLPLLSIYSLPLLLLSLSSDQLIGLLDCLTVWTKLKRFCWIFNYSRNRT